MSLASCIYEGTINHRRRKPEHSFQHKVAMAYLDLDELPGLLAGRLVDPRPGLVRFRRRDYFGSSSQPLGAAIRDLVAARSGRRPEGPIRLLTHLRSFGHCFNPVSFYYCFDDSGERIEAMVAEVTNTPWGERHAYVIDGAEGQFAKALHVSPFMEMSQSYRCHASTPAEDLAIHIESQGAAGRAFDAGLRLRRRELTEAALRRMTVRYPLATVRILALIYARALRIRLAGASVYPHPHRSSA